MLTILTSKSCTKCMMVKSVLENRGIPFKEVDYSSPDGEDIVIEFGVEEFPFIIDTNGETYKNPTKFLATIPV